MLSQYLESLDPSALAGRRAIELGAGTGLAGMVASALGKHHHQDKLTKGELYYYVVHHILDMHTYIYTYIQTDIHTYIHTCTCAHLQIMDKLNTCVN